MSFYRMHRGWMDNDAFRGEPYGERAAWVWIIENAAWEPKAVNIDSHPVQLERGDLSFSERFLATKWLWSRSRVHRYLAKLSAWKMISVRSSLVQKPDHQRDHPQNILTVCNYGTYQDTRTISEPQDEPSLNHKRTISEPKKKEVKEGKEDSEANASAKRDPAKEMWARGRAVLGESAGKLIGQALKTHTQLVVMEIILATEAENSPDPIAFFFGCLKQRASTRQSPGEKLYEGAFRAAEQWEQRSADSDFGGAVVVPLLDSRRSSGNA